MTDLAILLASNDWLRPLALRLVGPDRVDDALQQAVLEYAPRASSVRHMRAWFARVIGNFAKRDARDEARRRRHERASVTHRPAQAGATDDLVAQMEEQQRVAAAVLALAEPYRAVILAHFVEGLSTKEIAESTREPWATVRSRLARGISLLRADLERADKEWRDRLALAVLGVPAGRLGRHPASTALVPPAAALVALLAVGVPLAWGFSGVSAEVPSSAAITAAALAQMKGGSHDPVRTAIVVADAGATAPSDGGAGKVAYRGDVLNPLGEPLADVGLFVGEQRVGQTDARGQFEIMLAPGEHELDTDDGHVVLWSTPLAVGRANRFVAARRIRMQGQVVDHGDGRAVSPAQVEFHVPTLVDYPYSLRELEPRPLRAAGSVDAAGRFDFAAPWVDDCSLWVVAPGYHRSQSIRLGDSEREMEIIAESVSGKPTVANARETTPRRVPAFRAAVDVCFALRRRTPTNDPSWLTWAIEGNVVDAAGRPVSDASVAFPCGGTVRTAADGTFLIDVDSANILDGGHLIAWHKEHGAAAIEEPHERWRARGDKHPHETLQLSRADRELRGRVTDPEGRPLAGRRVQITDPLIAFDIDSSTHVVEAEAFDPGAMTGADGAFALRGLLPRNYRLRVLDLNTLQQVETAPFAAGVVDAFVVMPAPADLQPEWRGRIVDAQNEPIAGARAKASLWGPWGHVGRRLLHTIEAVADGEGKVTVPPCPAGVTVTFEAEGRMRVARTRAGLNDPEVRLGRIAAFRYRGSNPPESTNQRLLQVLDARDQPLVIVGPYGNELRAGNMHYLSGSKTGVLETSELATTLVIYTDDGHDERAKPHRFPVHLVPGEVTVIH